jgi:hypothetical protein
MLEMTPQAADVIATQCEQRALPATAGIRIYPRRTKKPDSVQTLVVEYVDGAEEGDTIIRHGSAAVFLAEGVDRIVGSRVLDAKDTAASSPQLLLRAPARSG